MNCLATRGDVMSAEEVIRHAEALLGPLAGSEEPLGAKTTYRVGGNAALYVEITTLGALESVVNAVIATHIDVLVIGNGSNLLVGDKGFSGLALRLGGRFQKLHIDADAGCITAGGAVAYPVLARRSVAESLSGLEWSVGIPGTVGGAITMNAGGHGAETKTHLLEAQIVNLSTGEDRQVKVDSLGCSYRHTNLGANDLVLEATFRATANSDRGESISLIEQIVRWRRENQPGGRNCGSVFTNPEGDAAGRIVEAAGLKGFRKGSAQVSEKHANFIQADNDGSADDVRTLIEEVRDLVAKRTGVELQTELRMVGFGC